ncbi:MAG: hypothetical protein Q9M31_02340 [Mariprofundus sp.]|nr:hypothetical protein [Mariprofundus sp.]
MLTHAEKNQPTLFIRRHCMQELIHAAITNNNHVASAGFLIKAGNILETQANVTQKQLRSDTDTINFIRQQQLQYSKNGQTICGIYHHNHTDQRQIDHISTLYHAALAQEPSYYLLLEGDHLGRIDALLYSDRDHTSAITLTMVEK